MTNAAIVAENTILLIRAGKIAPEDEIHTFQRWKELGFSVKKGEHAVAKFPVWKPSIKKNDNGEKVNTGRMFAKTSAFFSSAQVEPLKA